MDRPFAGQSHYGRIGHDEHSRRPPFQGGNDYALFPGLKTWAILLDHFMVAKQL
jgi:hypothetical protein